MNHCFTVCGERFVLDVGSGSLHKIDTAAYEILSKANNANDVRMLCDDIALANEIEWLASAKQLFTLEHEQDTRVGLEERKPVVKALCLHMAHECNLKCAYCFAGQGAYGGERGLMSAETGKKAIDFLITRSGSRRNLEVDFFGGEPMLNFNVVKEVVAYGRSREAETKKRFRFTLTTNGTLLDELDHAYINENMDNVVLSIDGRPAVHDRMRKQPNGVGGYNDIIEKLKKLTKSRNQEGYYVRGTYTRYNTDFSADVIHLADAGFKQISVEPVVACSDNNYAIRDKDIVLLCNEYEKLAQELLKREREGNPFRFFHFEIDLDGGPCIAKRITGCGAGSEYLAVTPGGSLYPCHQFVGDENFYLGNLDDGIIHTKWIDKFKNCDVLAKPMCNNCWAKYYCSGGCMAHAYQSNGDIAVPDDVACTLQKKRIECALYLVGMRRSGL